MRVKVLLIINIETGDQNLPYWQTPVLIITNPDTEDTINALEDSFSSYLEQSNPDESFEDIVSTVLNAADLEWCTITDGPIPACDGLHTIWI